MFVIDPQPCPAHSNVYNDVLYKYTIKNNNNNRVLTRKKNRRSLIEFVTKYIKVAEKCSL